GNALSRGTGKGNPKHSWKSSDAMAAASGERKMTSDLPSPLSAMSAKRVRASRDLTRRIAREDASGRHVANHDRPGAHQSTGTHFHLRGDRGAAADERVGADLDVAQYRDARRERREIAHARVMVHGGVLQDDDVVADLGLGADHAAGEDRAARAYACAGGNGGARMHDGFEALRAHARTPDDLRDLAKARDARNSIHELAAAQIGRA